MNRWLFAFIVGGCVVALVLTSLGPVPTSNAVNFLAVAVTLLACSVYGYRKG